MPNYPFRSFNKGQGNQGPLRSIYRVASGRAEYTDDIFGFNRYTCVHHYEDFEGYLNSHPIKWKSDTVTTAGSPTAAIVADSDNGEWNGTLAANNEAESARLTWGDREDITYNRPWRFEAYCKIPVAIAANQIVVIGLGSDYNATFDSMTKNFWFRVDGGTTLTVEVDDNVTNQDDLSTTLTMDQSYHLYSIFNDASGSIRFYWDKNLVYTVTGVVFTDTTLLQPFFAVQKASGTGVPQLTVDMADIWWERF